MVAFVAQMNVGGDAFLCSSLCNVIQVWKTGSVQRMSLLEDKLATAVKVQMQAVG
jgi:hypothetical protein